MFIIIIYYFETLNMRIVSLNLSHLAHDLTIYLSLTKAKDIKSTYKFKAVNLYKTLHIF